jgi:hypothetical protein
MIESQLRNITQISLKSLDGVVGESQSCSVHLRCLGTAARRLGAPFIVPRGLGDVGFLKVHSSLL